MKRSIVLFFFFSMNLAAFAQFPLGGSKAEIKSYFDTHIYYSVAQEFKTEDGIDALYFKKDRAIGDYVFLFDNNGKCNTYSETYDIKELKDLIGRFDAKFYKKDDGTWSDTENTFDAKLIQKPKLNFFTIQYTPLSQGYASASTSKSP